MKNLMALSLCFFSVSSQLSYITYCCVCIKLKKAVWQFSVWYLYKFFVFFVFFVFLHSLKLSRDFWFDDYYTMNLMDVVFVFILVFLWLLFHFFHFYWFWSYWRFLVVYIEKDGENTLTHKQSACCCCCCYM